MTDVARYTDTLGWGPPDDAQRIGPLAVEWYEHGSQWHLNHDGPCERDSAHIVMWHDCTLMLDEHSVSPGIPFGWRPSGIANHTVVTVEPLTIVASLYWPECCRLHGFLTDGAWVGC